MKEIDLVIDTEEIAEFFYSELARRGYIPSEDELFEIADITFDYLIEKCMIDEELDEDD
ncbi:YozD family protein [Bacillus inaquosorum]|uniref:YozD family protein n=1 Tax=Bacillus inaquosorum TaxID=483913 RepID=UPI002280D2C7|nr:YozD family protein [Bacillus inaquosorum]MCY7952103.1 YozD family protein [Bacillus inaquosorum]MCY8850914.1 YozD family protein [Bacillus inaquosorum]MCY8868960.1 YozD family protein [Bacillus inaquosorum]MCY9063590.1 YozD family protein [Bacillus inaquosorum]MCY9067413.1 YozD family protein [Bacillus inaquosorum]